MEVFCVLLPESVCFINLLFPHNWSNCGCWDVHIHAKEAENLPNEFKVLWNKFYLSEIFYACGIIDTYNFLHM